MHDKSFSIFLFLVFALYLAGCSLLPLDMDEEDPPVPVTSTYLCAEGRSFNASFDPEGRRASLMIEGDRRLLYRIRSSRDPAVFTDGLFSLHARHKPDPTIWLERSGLVVYRNCRQETAEE
jgi:hypothetical protein